MKKKTKVERNRLLTFIDNFSSIFLWACYAFLPKRSCLSLYSLGPGYRLTNHWDALLVHNAAGQEMEVEFGAIGHHSVSSVIAAL